MRASNVRCSIHGTAIAPHKGPGRPQDIEKLCPDCVEYVDRLTRRAENVGPMNDTAEPTGYEPSMGCYEIADALRVEGVRDFRFDCRRGLQWLRDADEWMERATDGEPIEDHCSSKELYFQEGAITNLYMKSIGAPSHRSGPPPRDGWQYEWKAKKVAK